MAKLSSYKNNPGINPLDKITYSGIIEDYEELPTYETVTTTLDDLGVFFAGNYFSVDSVNYDLGGIDSRITTLESRTVVLEATITVTPSQILNLSGGGEIELISAPAANKVLLVENIALYLNFNTTPYIISSAAPAIAYKHLSNYQLIVTTPVLNSSDIYTAQNTLNGLSTTVPNSLVCYLPVGNTISDGDSDLKINIKYRIIDFN